MHTTLTSKGQMTLPSAVLSQLGWRLAINSV
jgi:bifunctional DNA-binding transcriptional regulator/antitoxin component of YhaV-PrlF toxin-antitoxin module